MCKRFTGLSRRRRQKGERGEGRERERSLVRPCARGGHVEMGSDDAHNQALHSSSVNEASHHWSSCFKGHIYLHEKILSHSTTDLHFACIEGLFRRGGKGRSSQKAFTWAEQGRGGIRRDLIGFILECRGGGGNLAISRGSKEGTIWRFHGQASISADCKTAAVHANVLSSSDVFYAARPEETATSPPQPQ